MSAPRPAKIRLAKASDVPAIHAMLLEIAKATDCVDKFKSSIDDLIRDGFGKNPAFEALVGVDGETPVAVSLYFPSYSTFRGKAGLYIQDLYVAPAYRGGGFAREMVRAAAKRANETGKAYIRLSVDAENHVGQRFYEKLGMRHADDEMIFVLDGKAFEDVVNG
jgi:ribosomal protein S18 acetylase RimI-like enzyme